MYENLAVTKNLFLRKKKTTTNDKEQEIMTFPKEIFLFLTFPSSGDIMSQVKEALKQVFLYFSLPLP